MTGRGRVWDRVDRRRWSRFRRRLLDERGWRCEACGRAGRLELHHVEGVQDGGAVFDPSNVRILCRTCHANVHRGEKPAKTPGRDEWRAFAAELLEKTAK